MIQIDGSFISRGARKDLDNCICEVANQLDMLFGENERQFNRLRARTHVNRMIMNGIVGTKNIKFVISMMYDPKISNRMLIRASHLILDPLLEEEQKMVELRKLSEFVENST